MPKNQIETTFEQISNWAVDEILKAKAKWLHLCYAVIMPDELYKKAAGDNALRECTEWGKRNGYMLRDYVGETHLVKGPLIVGVFRPVLRGEKAEKHIEFEASVNGVRVEVVEPQPMMN